MKTGFKRPLSVWQAMLVLQLVLLVPGLLVQGFIYSRWYQAARDEQLHERLRVAESVSRIVQTYVLGVRHQAEAVGTVLQDMRPGPEENTLLETVGRKSESVGFMHWTSPQGTIIASSVPSAVGTTLANQSLLRDVEKGKNWEASDLFIQPASGAPAFVVASAARKNGKLNGIIVAEVEVAELQKILSQNTQGEVAVYDSKGVLVFQYPKAIQLTQTSRIQQDSLLGQALRGEQAVGETRSLVDGSRQLSARVPIPELGWVAGASHPRSELVSPMIRSFVTVLGVMVLVIFGSSAITIVISRRVVGDVRLLQKHAQALGRGELDHTVEISGISELKELAIAYREMAARRKEAQEAQQQLAEKLAYSNQELQHFAYVASHDLQEPLRMVSSFMQLLEKQYKGKLDDKADQYIGFAVDGADRMSRLINDLLAYSRVDTKEFELKDVDCNLVFQEALQNLQAAISESSAAVRSEDLPTVKGNYTLLVRLFQNLIGNGIKFQDRGTPDVHVGARLLGTEWEFSVRDNGIGIDPGQADRLFMMFQRLHNRRKYAGTGIGLAICKRIVQRHGGRIWVESQPGSGSTFLFTIPAAP